MGARSVESNVLHTVVTTSESFGPPSFAKSRIRRAYRGQSFANIHRDSINHNNTEREACDLRANQCRVMPSSQQLQRPDPQMPEPARQVSPSGREDSVQKRQRPAEVTTVLTITGVCSGTEIATLTDDQNAMHTANLKELLNMDKIWCGGGGRQTAIATSSLDTLGIET